MRRIYYAYALQVVTHPLAYHSALIALCFVLLAQFVSFPNVWANMLELQVREVHTFLFNSMQHTEVWTWVIAGSIAAIAVSLLVRMRPRRSSDRFDVVHAG